MQILSLEFVITTTWAPVNEESLSRQLSPRRPRFFSLLPVNIGNMKKILKADFFF